MILIVASNKDVASLNIAKHILNHYDFKEEPGKTQQTTVYKTEISYREVKLFTLNTESIYAQNLTDFFPNPELVIFVSRHSSESGTPTLSVHTPGNLNEAKLGGIPHKVSVAPANAIRNALKTMTRLRQELDLPYDVSYECTHHGPSLDVPTMFAELGSSPKQWSNSNAAEAVARATMEAIVKFDEVKVPAAIGIGGTHYNAKFTRMALGNELAFGHIIPKYAIPHVTAEVLKQCVEKTLETVELIVLDWKGIRSEDKPKLVAMIEKLGLPYRKA